MTVDELTRQGRASLERLIKLFRDGEATDFIASEFLLAPEISECVHRDSKFGRALANADMSIRKEGFDWWDPPKELKIIVEKTRRQIESAESDEIALSVLEALISEENPDFISDVVVP